LPSPCTDFNPFLLSFSLLLPALINPFSWASSCPNQSLLWSFFLPYSIPSLELLPALINPFSWASPCFLCPNPPLLGLFLPLPFLP
jgi:hypothetical protein